MVLRSPQVWVCFRLFAGAAGGADTECLCLGWYAAMYARAWVTVYGVRRTVPRDDRRGRGRGRVMVYAVCDLCLAADVGVGFCSFVRVASCCGGRRAAGRVKKHVGNRQQRAGGSAAQDQSQRTKYVCRKRREGRKVEGGRWQSMG